MNVRSLILTTGQELVAELVEAEPLYNGYKLRNPLVVHVLRGQGGEGQLAFAQWSMVVPEGEVAEIPFSAILRRPMPVIEEVAQSYAQQVTGLLLPPSAVGGQILQG